MLCDVLGGIRMRKKDKFVGESQREDEDGRKRRNLGGGSLGFSGTEREE